MEHVHAAWCSVIIFQKEHRVKNFSVIFEHIQNVRWWSSMICFSKFCKTSPPHPPKILRSKWIPELVGASQIFGGCGGGVSQNIKPVVITFVNCNEILKSQKFTTRTYWRLPNQKIMKILREIPFVFRPRFSRKKIIFTLGNSHNNFHNFGHFVFGKRTFTFDRHWILNIEN